MAKNKKPPFTVILDITPGSEDPRDRGRKTPKGFPVVSLPKKKRPPKK